ncbi:hypothetical protein ABMA28_006783 [Loxostege sticticalis]|uniref:Integrase catalytic domain-containing protein n=1 Tax=Loxostege sticticalis TaxID=481309 RepID=A0ABD0TNC8_LOXSC
MVVTRSQTRSVVNHTAQDPERERELLEREREREQREREREQRERERERELALLQQEADELELRAKLASLESRSDKSRSISSRSIKNLARLTSNVRGAAQVAISSILWQAQDPEEIMAALEQNYARPELLIAQEIAGLRNIKISSPEHLNTLANKLRNCTQGPSYSKAQGPSVSKAPNFLNVHVTDSKDKTAECTYCKQGAHTIKKCKAFSSLTVEDRWRWVRENKICYRCLKSNPHKWNDCRAKRCGVNNCTRRHHALLHGNAVPDDRNKASTNTPNSPQDASNNIVEPHRAADDVVATTCGVPATGIRGLLKILPVTLEGPRGTTDTFALLDEGSTATLIDGDVATRIGAEVTGRQQLRVTGVGGMSLDTEVCYVNFHIRGPLIKKQYEIDSLGITKRVTRQNNDDARAIDLVESSARRLSTGRFEVGLPWREKATNNVPDSYPQALSRLKSLERQMAKDETFASAYKGFIDGVIQKGYAEDCELSSYHESYAKSSTGESIRWYLPHFGIFHPQKRKLRVVHDAAATTRGVSLNNMLLQGPDLLQSLLNILFRFREGPIAFNADIREMFPQIKIRESDRDALRFLWRNGNSKEAVKEYRMSSLIFGAVSSPFIAVFIKNKNAKEFEDKYPTATHAIIYDHYMDDYIGSEFDLDHASRLASEIVTVHKSGGFEMRSWISNVPEALALVPKELHSDSGAADVNLPPDHDVGALGVKWNPFNDTLGFRTGHKFTGSQSQLTKRGSLSSVMSVYDPLGLLMPVVIQGRILIQKLWRDGADWDSPIPTKYEAECKSWFEQLASAASLRVPRWYVGRSDLCDTQLHVIADGGEQAYACVAYWRYTFTDGSVSLALIGSKARVAPLKPLSIPRLELQAALIATRFAQTILSAHRTQPSAVFYWTDSTTVLKWIRSDARTFKAFVAHRLGEILEFSNPSNWRWLPSELNVADDATKPKSLELSPSHRWFAGPSFLLNDSVEWPREPDCTVTYEASGTSELKPEFAGLLTATPLLVPPVPDPSRFSSWLRLLRATARVVQAVRTFVFKSSSPRLLARFANNTTSPSQLSTEDVFLAEKMLFQKAQMESFAEELKVLRASQPVPKSSSIAALAPILDEDGLIRLDSRIKSVPGVRDSVKSPIILDGRNRIARLIILHKHHEAGHGNHEMVLNEIRQQFWILRARATIRSVVKGCLLCRRQKGRLLTPTTGDLPLERLDHHKRPFTHVGLDYFGPVEVTVGRRREKRYVALYTCLVTRAIHLEVAASLSSDSAIMSLRRLIARRGTPSTIFSDNGTNFIGANRELASLYDEDVENFASSRKISWRFIPPAAPFMGGAWERMVRSVKTALRATLRNRAPREEVFNTLLVEAESIVNSRPLTYVTDSPGAPEALTPFHFILGSASVAPWPVQLSDQDLLRRCDWRHALRLADHFWKRWLTEYLPTLIPRGRNRRDIDFVLLKYHTLTTIHFHLLVSYTVHTLANIGFAHSNVRSPAHQSTHFRCKIASITMDIRYRGVSIDVLSYVQLAMIIRPMYCGSSRLMSLQFLFVSFRTKGYQMQVKLISVRNPRMTKGHMHSRYDELLGQTYRDNANLRVIAIMWPQH